VRHRLYIVSVAILIAGLCSGTAIHFLSEDLPDGGDGYVIVDGQKYPAGVYQSKRYQRELERYGGKANVIFDELNRWFASLWQGKRLGVTLGSISVIASLGLFFLARFLYPKRDS
jgi:hypothetical protein